MFTVSSGFISNFKLGDNINHTLRVLAALYRTQRADSDPELLCKPITILIGSACEAILYDLHLRIRIHTFEGVKNVAENVIAYIRGKHIDEFDKYIASVKKHDLFKDAGLYASLEELRKLRNRVHIQNTKGHFEPYDGNAFSMARQIEAEKTLEKVVKIMAKRHARPASVQGYVADFQLPWDEHFSK